MVQNNILPTFLEKFSCFQSNKIKYYTFLFKRKGVIDFVVFDLSKNEYHIIIYHKQIYCFFIGSNNDYLLDLKQKITSPLQPSLNLLFHIADQDLSNSLKNSKLLCKRESLIKKEFQKCLEVEDYKNCVIYHLLLKVSRRNLE